MLTLPSHLELSSGTTLQLVAADGAWRGIGTVSVGGISLRSGRLPLSPAIRSPDATTFTAWHPLDLQRHADGWDLVLEPTAETSGVMDWMLHSVRNRVRVGDWSSPQQRMPGTRLTLELRAATRRLGGHDWQGFSYRYRYASDQVEIYRLLDRGSWEIGGDIADNTFWHRGSFAPPEVRFSGSANESFSTEWHLPGIHNPDIFQFIPWQTGGQGFSFTWSEAGVLVTWATDVTHIRSLFEKPKDWKELLHLHEHCSDLGKSLDTVPLEVLFCPGRFDRSAAINLYEAVRDMVWDRLHERAGLRRERVQTYAVVEEWGLPDFARYTEQALPALAPYHPDWIFIPNEFQNDMNTWGVSNMCCTVDLKISAAVGEDHLTAFCAAAQAQGSQVEMWGNTSFSSLSYIFSLRDPIRDDPHGRIKHLPFAGSVGELAKRTPQFWVRNASGAIEADHYTPVFCCANLREAAVTSYWHASWRDLRERIGISGIFLDSSFNLSSDKFHWIGQVGGVGGATVDQTSLLGRTRPEVDAPRAILSQYHAHLQLIADMQRYGYRYSGEDVGLFGVNRSGPDATKRMTAWHLWSESVCEFDAKAIAAAGADPDEIFFTGLAFRVMWILYWQCRQEVVTWRHQGPRDHEDRPTAQQTALLLAFRNLAPDMITREVLPQHAGVHYRHGERHTLWSFRACRMRFAETVTVEDALSGQRESASEFNVPAWSIRTWSGPSPEVNF